jgi:hypothetical protein
MDERSQLVGTQHGPGILLVSSDRGAERGAAIADWRKKTRLTSGSQLAVARESEE